MWISQSGKEVLAAREETDGKHLATFNHDMKKYTQYNSQYSTVDIKLSFDCMSPTPYS